jgi:hypothetical protein
MGILVEVAISVKHPVPSPRRGEGQGEGVPGFDWFTGRVPPHPNPLPAGERGRTVHVARLYVPIEQKLP